MFGLIKSKYANYTKNNLLGYKGRFLFLCIFLSGCATYQSKVERARTLLESHDAEKAIGLLKPLAKEDGKDQLIYIFDYATALQIAGKYKESNQELMAADRMSDRKNYLSVSRFGGSGFWRHCATGPWHRHSWQPTPC